MVSETLQDVNIKVGAKGHSHCKTPSKQKFPVASELQFHHHILKLSQNPADKVTGDCRSLSEALEQREGSWILQKQR